MQNQYVVLFNILSFSLILILLGPLETIFISKCNIFYLLYLYIYIYPIRSIYHYAGDEIYTSLCITTDLHRFRVRSGDIDKHYIIYK